MKAKSAVEIFNLYDVLPGYGETSIELTRSNNIARLYIHYDSKADPHKQDTVVLVFENCVACELASFPGISMYECDRGNSNNLGSLIEFKASGYADMWNKHFGNRNNEIRHFSVLFLAENKQFHAFANEVNWIIE